MIPTPEAKYAALRTRINKHCPDLMELRFGCEVKGELYIWKAPDESETIEFATVITQAVPKDDGSGESLYYGVGDFELERENISTILGIPPTLQDVLRAIDGYVAIGNTGQIVDAHTGGFEGIYYDLTKPLSEQSEETLDFLLSVIE